jgi:hypothetical protein
LYRLALLLLVIIPFVPEILIFVVAAVARLMGCQPDQKGACVIGSIPVSDVIASALQISAGLMIAGVRSSNVWIVVFYIGVATWLVVCFIVLIQAWTRVHSRLLVGLVVALVFAILPYFGPMLSIANLANENCKPNEGSVSTCMIFGGYVGAPGDSPAHDAVLMGWLFFPYGALVAFGLFGLYAVTVMAVGVFSKRHLATSE